WKKSRPVAAARWKRALLDRISTRNTSASASNYRSRIGHSHREQEEVYLVVSGSGRVKLDDEIIDLKQWDVVRVAPSTVRAFEGGPDGLELVAVGSDRPEGGDGQRVEDWWTAGRG